MRRRRSLSTAGPLLSPPSLRSVGFPVWPFPCGDRFLCADLELTPEVREDHASYIGHWLNVTKQDNRAIFTAAAHAQRAVDYLHRLLPEAKAEAAA